MTEPVAAGGLTTVELFAGIGCVSQGFAGTGAFQPVLLTDIDPVARDTFVENYPDGPPYLVTDVRDVTADTIRNGVDGRDVDGLLGCPPCQGFSAAGRRDAADPQNALLVNFFTLARALRVKFFVMENVPSVIDQELFKRQITTMRRWYRVWHGPLNAALYGLPQTRQRCIVIGYRKDLEVEPSAPPISHLGSRAVFDYKSGKRLTPSTENADAILGPYPRIGHRREAAAGRWLPERLDGLADLVTVGEALGDLPAEGCQDGETLPSSQVAAYAAQLRGADSAVHNHQPWRHTFAARLAMSGASEGGSFGPGRSAGYYSQAYTRLHRDGLARTVTTNFHNAGSGRFTHYAAGRTLTVREAARLQGIPDSFRFIGYRSWQERLVGNAFPQHWAQSVAEHIREQLANELLLG
ncbi:MAG TPA: DNA cytosine methyltransferase [Acidimicrobiales bacterium]|nr:DNA cytosine methyltransferase [Acidimicrobiales bacterium]